MKAAIRERIELVSAGLKDTSPAFQRRVKEAMAMYRAFAKKSEIIEAHGSIVAREALTALDRSDPSWWRDRSK